MILDVYAFRNKKMQCYANPYFSQDKKENIEINMSRAIFAGGPEARLKYKSLALYFFGTFDDATGKYQLLDTPELILDCDDIIASIPED